MNLHFLLKSSFGNRKMMEKVLLKIKAQRNMFLPGSKSSTMIYFGIVTKGKFYAFLRNFDIVATLLLNPLILIFLLILITIV